MKDLSRQVLRYSLALMFLWFAWQQLSDPSSWVVFLPTWTGYLPVPAEMMIMANAWLEAVAAVALIAGVFVRPVAVLLCLHLVAIAWEISGAIGARDMTLALSALALALSPADPWTLDYQHDSKVLDSDIA